MRWPKLLVETSGVGGRGLYSDILIQKHVAWTIFGVQNFEIQYFGGFQKKNIFWGNEEIVDIFGVIKLLD